MLRAIQSSAPLTLHAPVRAAIIVLAMAGSQGLAQDCMWVPLNATGPASQYYPPVAAWDSTRQRMVVVESRQNDLMLRTWEWDGTSWTLRAQGGPSNRCWHEIAYDQARARVVLFGGTAGFTPVPNDTWEWDGNVWALAASAGPPARYYHAMAYDAARSQVVLFGGNNPAFTQTWAWNGMTWFQVATSGPPFRQGAGMAYDATRQRTILFGGYINPNTAFNDLWEWDGAAWTQRFPSNSPSPRSDVAFAFDPLRSRFLMFSGALGNAAGLPSETWEFDGLANSWQFRTGGGPPAGAGRPLAFDPVRGVGILVDQLGTTWQWSGNAALSAPWITQHPSSLQASPGASVTVSVTASGDPQLQYQWRRSGVALVNGGSISGVTSPTLMISPAAISDSGYYTVDVANSCGSTTSQAAHIQIGPLACYVNCDLSTTPPILNVNDMICFLNRYAAGDPYANCDNSTYPPILNVNDFGCFLNRYAGGCL